MNFMLRPSPMQLEFQDLCFAQSDFLDLISKYCIDDLHAHQSETLKKDRGSRQDTWIVQGASARLESFRNFLITPQGLKVIFDPYQVSCYAEGRREVFIPKAILSGHVKEPFIDLMK